jgi:hypothetical protein
MRRLWFTILVLISLAVAVVAQPKQSADQTLINYEKQSWESVKQKDYKKFESFIADDFVDIFSNGQVVNKRELVQKYIRGVDLVDYSLSKFRVVMLDKDAAVVVYEAGGARIGKSDDGPRHRERQSHRDSCRGYVCLGQAERSLAECFLSRERS